MLNISDLEICAFRVEHLRAWVLCLAWNISDLEICVSCVIISGLGICVCLTEYPRSSDLCIPCWLSQSSWSVSPWVNISDLEFCVNRELYFRVLSLCQMRRITQNLKSVSTCQKTQIPKSVFTLWISQYSWSVSNDRISQSLKSVSHVQTISFKYYLFTAILNISFC